MIILITGVSSGFGKAIAQALVANGHKVFGTVRRNVEPLEGVTYLQADVQDDSQISEAFNQMMKLTEDRIDVFINNAGIGIGGPIASCKIEDIQKQMDVNFLGMVRWLSHVVPVMRKQSFGKILCISSIGGLIGLPYQGAYSASKFAIEGFCEALRLELLKSGVSVSLIEPGDFSTGLTATRKSVDIETATEAYPSYARSLASIESDEKNGLSPDYLASRICRIVEKKNPAYNYVVATFLQRLAVFAKWLLPAPAFAWILSIYYKL